MASKEFSTDFKDALNQMQASLQTNNFIEKFQEVKDFLQRIDQADAEKSMELVLNQCQDFVREDKVTKIQGAGKVEINEIKKVLTTFLNQAKRVTTQPTAKGGSPGFSQTLPPSISNQKLDVLVQPVAGHYKTVLVTGKTGQQDKSQGSSPKSMKKDITVNADKAGKAVVDGTKGKDVQENMYKELEEKVKRLSEIVQQKEREIEDKKRMNEKFEADANKKYLEIQELLQERSGLQVENEKLFKENELLRRREKDLQSEVHVKTEEWNAAILQYEEASKDVEHYKKKVSHLEDSIKAKERQNDERVQKLVAERDDLRNRYSKVAGQKLKDNNSDISDLSDPNRPMKLGEKFSELYDNEWTDAFDAQTDKLKKNEKDSIKFLLDALQDCYSFCIEIAERQKTELINVFLYNCQDMNKPVTKDKPRLHSNQERALLEVRKTIAATKPEPVKQQFLEKMKGKPDEKCPKEITTYFEKCTEICWLLAIHNPPLYMDTEFKPGTKIDLNLYTPYYTPGDKTDFLVWPPLFNVKNGGLLNKGVMAPVQEKKKIKK